MKLNFLDSAKKGFQLAKMLGDKTFAQLDDEQLFWQANEDSNSIAIIVKHLWGNMLSRWTNFLTEDGEKEWRQREAEFEPDIKNRKELIEKWEAGWACLFDALSSVNIDNFDSPIYIRNQEHTIIEAINRQLGHYSYHVGQIVFIGKMLKGAEWKSLSIPKGKSAEFNKEKFSKAKNKQHYTDEFLKDED